MRDARILITGSRTWTDVETIERDLGILASGFLGMGKRPVLVAGGAKGADTIAENFFRRRGWAIEIHNAQWEQYGKRAGYIRNAKMVELGADICLAFIRDKSKGATMCANLAETAGIQVIRVTA